MQMMTAAASPSSLVLVAFRLAVLRRRGLTRMMSNTKSAAGPKNL
jgi:hypothetical protein